MVKNETIIPSIRSIFEKDDHGRFANNASLYQDILQYTVKTPNKEFKLRELGYWLLDKNREFRIRYGNDKRFSSDSNIPKNNRFYNIRHRLETKIQDLIQLGLLFSGTTRAEKVNTQIPLYTLTGDGYFIALLLERMTSEKKGKGEKSNNILYDLIQSTLKEYDSSSLVITSECYRICRGKGLLEDALDAITNNLSYYPFITKIIDAIILAFMPVFRYPTPNDRLSLIYYQTIDNVKDNHLRLMMLYNMKLIPELKISNQHPSREWEQMWLKNIDNYSKVVAYGRCCACHKEYPIAVDNDIKMPFRYLLKDCVNCNKKKTVKISDHISARRIRITKRI